MAQGRRPAPPSSAKSSRAAWLGEIVTGVYIALITSIAQATHLSYVLFPELGALSHDIFKRPQGVWAKAPLMLVLTPFLAGVIGTIVTRHLAYGFLSVLLSVGSSMLVIRVLRSPIAPAMSAGLLPLSLGISSWLYAPSLLIGLGSLAVLSIVWRRLVPPSADAGSPADIVDDLVEETPYDYSWVPFFLGFLLIAILLTELSGSRLLLFPPLVVIAFEMFAHSQVCPWAKRPLVLPIACTLNATAGLLLVTYVGSGPITAVCSMAFGSVVLRAFDLHVPPALAVGLLPFVISKPGYQFPVSVGIGTLISTTSFLAWRKVAEEKLVKQ